MLRLETITGNVANEPMSDRQWYQKGPSGERIAPGNPNFADMSPLAAFVHMMHLKADETVVQWYGKGGAFVDAGLPMYLALECKPDNGGEIQNLGDGSARAIGKAATATSEHSGEVLWPEARQPWDCHAGEAHACRWFL